MIYTNIVYLSYGNEHEYRRSIFCILSFVSWNQSSINNVRIIVYTDKPDYFKVYLYALNVEYFLLTPKMLEEMLGDTSFIHRRKVVVIDWTFRDYPNQDVLFLDSDTIFTSETVELYGNFQDGTSLMHKREYTIGEGLKVFMSYKQGQYPRAFISYITGKEFLIAGIKEVFTKHDFSWNSGVIGLKKEFAGYMKDVLKLTDEFYSNSKWFISEQLAFSLILQRRTKLKPAEKFVLHYWGRRQKILIDFLLRDLFNKRTYTELRDQFYIQTLTKNLKSTIQIDLLTEQAIISISKGSWYYGMKKILQLILKGPSKVRAYRKFLESITNRFNKKG